MFLEFIGPELIADRVSIIGVPEIMAKILEVVSKFQIGFKGPAKRDYISYLKKIKVCIKR